MNWRQEQMTESTSIWWCNSIWSSLYMMMALQESGPEYNIWILAPAPENCLCEVFSGKWMQHWRFNLLLECGPFDLPKGAKVGPPTIISPRKTCRKWISLRNINLNSILSRVDYDDGYQLMCDYIDISFLNQC